MSVITNNDLIGIAGVGTQTTHTTAFGGNWQFGIAIDLNNRKFEFGKIIKYSIAKYNIPWAKRWPTSGYYKKDGA